MHLHKVYLCINIRYICTHIGVLAYELALACMYAHKHTHRFIKIRKKENCHDSPNLRSICHFVYIL